jgi:hypothetical protein
MSLALSSGKGGETLRAHRQLSIDENRSLAAAHSGYAANASLSAIGPKTRWRPSCGYSFRNSSGRFATLAAIRRASDSKVICAII